MKILLPICLVILSSCYSIPTIEGFDEIAWDENSCDDPRSNQIEAILSQSGKLLAEGQSEIKTLLGQPDEHELYNRNQKFFYYDLTKPDCSGVQTVERLSIRFDALDRVKEVLVIE